MSPTDVATNEPGSATSPSWPTYCHERRKMRSRSSWSTAGSVYQLHGRVLVPTALTRGTLPADRPETWVGSRPDERAGRRRCRSARPLLEEAEATLAPLSLASEPRVVGVAGQRDRGECRASRAGGSRVVGRARRPRRCSPPSTARETVWTATTRRQLDLLHNLMVRRQVPDDAPRANHRARDVGRPAFLALPRRRARGRGRRHRDQADPSPERRPRRAP